MLRVFHFIRRLALGANLLQTIWGTLSKWKDILADTRTFHAVKNWVAWLIFKQDLHLQI